MVVTQEQLKELTATVTEWIEGAGGEVQNKSSLAGLLEETMLGALGIEVIDS